MFSLIPVCFVIRAVMLRLGLGFVLVCVATEAQAVEQDDDFIVTKFNLLTARFVKSRADFLPNYRFSAGVVLARPAETMPSGLGSSSRLSLAVRQQQETVQPTNTHWRHADDGVHVSPARLLRLEFRKDPIKISFRPHSISIKGERLKFQLRQDLVSMMWSNVF